MTETSAKAKTPANTLTARLKDTAGFMLGEQLLSIIFIGLLCIAVSAGIGAALAAQAGMTDLANANQLLTRTVAELNDELAYSLEVQGTASDAGLIAGASYISASTHTPVRLTNAADGGGIAMTGSALGGRPEGGTTIDEVLFIPKTGQLTPHLSTLPAYNKVSNSWEYTVQIKKNGTVLKEQTMKVARVMPAGA